MNGCEFSLAGARLTALGSGALWWPAERLLCVSDLHLGKSERTARRGGALLPPYETRDTLARLEQDMAATGAATVICLGDSFDDLRAADGLCPDDALWLTRLMAGRRWIWIEGNHDPGPLGFGGTHMAAFRAAALTFRHIADPGASGEVSGHYHPKLRLSPRGRSMTRPCFLCDENRVILPAFGTYTGGLRSDDPAFMRLLQPGAIAILTGQQPRAVPWSRR